MSQLHGQGFGQGTDPSTDKASFERPAAADDIVDPIDVRDGRSEAALDREQTDEEAEDVPLEVKFTDALSMLADGGHDYGATPLVPEDDGEEPSLEGRPDLFDIDESSKDA